jgi:hypothetical protein
VRRFRLPWWSAPIIIFTGIVLGGLLCPNARADDRVDNYAATNALRVCTVLDSFPTFAGIEGIADAIHFNDGFNYSEAGRIERLAVTAACPRHTGLLDDFVAAYGTPAVMPTGGAIGGPYRA